MHREEKKWIKDCPIILRKDENQEWPSDEDSVSDNDDSIIWDYVHLACGTSQTIER